jgi:DHA2 family multidrug resistance protein
MPRWSFARFGTDWSDDPTAMPTARKFLIFGLMAFGQFLALFDIQIVSACSARWRPARRRGG